MSDLPEETTVVTEVPPPMPVVNSNQRLAGSPLGEILLSTNKCTLEQIQEALLLQQEEKPDSRIGELLVGLKHLTEMDVAQALALQFEMPLLELS